MTNRGSSRGTAVSSAFRESLIVCSLELGEILSNDGNPREFCSTSKISVEYRDNMLSSEAGENSGDSAMTGVTTAASLDMAGSVSSDGRGRSLPNRDPLGCGSARAVNPDSNDCISRNMGDVRAGAACQFGASKETPGPNGFWTTSKVKCRVISRL